MGNRELLFIITTVILLAIILILIIIFARRIRNIRREYEKKAKLDEETRRESGVFGVELLRSQIQPHFLYNVLNTIKYLCRKNPDEAMEAIDRFSGFLRESMEAISHQECIPFEDEIKIVENYVFLEKKRFGEKVKVVFNLDHTNFKVPSLSVQTLVENAIKHGITRQIGGGCVWINSEKLKDGARITITDNGVGFYPEKEPADGKVHVGIPNTRNRLELMCKGSLNIESEIGEKTVATIFIPAGD